MFQSNMFQNQTNNNNSTNNNNIADREHKRRAKKKAREIVSKFYNEGRNLRSLELKRYTSGDGNNLGVEKLVKKIIELVLNACIKNTSRYHISNKYFVHPDDKDRTIKYCKFDPQRLDWHVFIDGRCVLLVESRSWIDKPFFILKRAAIRNFMELSYLKQQLHPNVEFVIAGLSIDIKDRLRTCMDSSMGYGSIVSEFALSPHRRGYKNKNYFDFGFDEIVLDKLIDFLFTHFSKFL